jgi:hypothetical protein
MGFKCESKHPKFASGIGQAEAVGIGQAGLDASIPKAESKAIDDSFQQAMAILESGACECEKPCQRRFTVTFDLTHVGKVDKFKANGATIFRANVGVFWTLDVECKRAKPGEGIRNAKRV